MAHASSPLPLQARIRELVEDLRKREDQIAIILSVVVGAIVGTIVVAFIVLTGRLGAYIYPAHGAGWRRILAPTLGSLITGVLLFRFFPDARGSGIPQTRAALFIHEGRITLRTIVGKFVCCSTALASGIALGREGPSVHIGAGVASVLARRLGLSKSLAKWLVPVGGAAALSAAFNTPIAAVLFALEEIMGDLHAPILGSVVLSSTTSWVVLHAFLGDEPLFHVAPYELVHPVELLVYAALGVVGGVGSVGFVRLLLFLRQRFLALPRKTAWIHPVAGGLVVGILGYFVPEVLGVGYDQVDKVLNGNVVLTTVVLFAALKMVATSACYASGNAGGIFGPSMFIGAMMGAAVGQIAHLVLPMSTGSPGAYALVGMGTAFAGIIRTPLTSVIMIFEVTRDYTIIVPLMISNMIAFYISQRLQHEPIYEALARQDGIHLPTGHFRARARALGISVALREAPPTLASTMTVGEAAKELASSDLRSWVVADEHGFVDMIRARDIEDASAAGDSHITIAELLYRTQQTTLSHSATAAHLHADQPLGQALVRMGETRHNVLPVVSRANVRQLMGIVTLADILKAYGVEHAEDIEETNAADD